MKHFENIVIRRARRKDLLACDRIRRIHELAPPNRPGDERDWLGDFLKTKQIFLVAESDGKVVGFAMGETATGHVAILHLLGVHPDWRSRGIGTKLLKGFETEAHRRKVTCILTYGYARKKTTQIFYRRHGYAAGSLLREFQKFL